MPVHIAVDVQDRFLSSLSQEKREFYKKRVRSFADTLAEKGIETIWVAMPNTLIPADVAKLENTTDLKDGWGRAFHELAHIKIATKKNAFDLLSPQLGLPELRDNEKVFLKYVRSAFVYDIEAVWITKQGARQTGDSLGEYLTRNNQKEIYLSGLHSSQCVAQTINDALLYNFRVAVACDLLADTTVWTGERPEDFMAIHRRLIQNELKVSTDKLVYSNQKQILANEAWSEIKREQTLRKPFAFWVRNALFAS